MPSRTLDGMLYVLAMGATAAIAPRTPVYWDTFGYVLQAMSGEVGGLGLGRPVFVLISHAISNVLLALTVSPWRLEPILRLGWALVAWGAAPVTRHLAIACGLRARGAFFAGLAVACSPAMAHTSGTLLTDGPAVTLFLVACLCAARALARSQDPRSSAVWCAAAGLAMGLAIGIREQALLGLLTLALLVPAFPSSHRARVALVAGGACALVVAGPLVIVLLIQPGYLDTVRGWIAGMEHDRTLKTFGWQTAAVFSAWVLSLGPAVVVASIGTFARHFVWRSGTTLFAIAVSSLVQLVVMGVFQGAAYSPRYFLPAFPGALAIPGALFLEGWTKGSRARLTVAVMGIVLPVVIAAPVVRARSEPLEAAMRALPAMLQEVPARSVIVSGQPCPAVPLVERLISYDRRAPAGGLDWQTVCPGWTWPASLPARLNQAIGGGRSVVLDVRSTSWLGVEQRAALEEVRRYRRDRAALAARGVLIVWE